MKVRAFAHEYNNLTIQQGGTPGRKFFFQDEPVVDNSMAAMSASAPSVVPVNEPVRVAAVAAAGAVAVNAAGAVAVRPSASVALDTLPPVESVSAV